MRRAPKTKQIIEIEKPKLSKHEEIWLRAWIAVAQSSNSTAPATATSWADDCLAKFRARFEAK